MDSLLTFLDPSLEIEQSAERVADAKREAQRDLRKAEKEARHAAALQERAQRAFDDCLKLPLRKDAQLRGLARELAVARRRAEVAERSVTEMMRRVDRFDASARTIEQCMADAASAEADRAVLAVMRHTRDAQASVGLEDAAASAVELRVTQQEMDARRTAMQRMSDEMHGDSKGDVDAETREILASAGIPLATPAPAPRTRPGGGGAGRNGGGYGGLGLSIGLTNHHAPVAAAVAAVAAAPAAAPASASSEADDLARLLDDMVSAPTGPVGGARKAASAVSSGPVADSRAS